MIKFMNAIYTTAGVVAVVIAILSILLLFLL
jgi:hypothetical protein